MPEKIQEDLYGPELVDDRPSWNAYHMLNALMIAERASCRQRLKVGAVIVKDNRQTSTGYNGAPPGESTCIEKGCLLVEGESKSCKRVIHAEINAILQNSAACKGASIFVNWFPCLNCMTVIVAVGIKRVVYLEKRTGKKYKERHELVKTKAKQHNISLVKLDSNDRDAIINLLFNKTNEIRSISLA